MLHLLRYVNSNEFCRSGQGDYYYYYYYYYSR